MKGCITAFRQGVHTAAKAADRNNSQVTFENCAPFTGCISEKNNTQVDNAKDLDVIMPMYNLIEYSNDNSKKSGSLC